MTSHSFPLRVYYEDTDSGGVVYYANYLKFAERARTEWLRDLGFSHSVLLANHGVLFVVSRVEADFKAPARLDDALTITTQILDIRKVRLHLKQAVLRGNQLLCELTVELACVDKSMKPSPLPPEISNLAK